ncbi:phosphatase PAP2 family protein [Zhihengliuella halotolerans]|uniref:phosphatase PAP2 family protein n=1 Tax=Zhihengliuella halotolerans TaxID=370736 RepID=UPI0015E08613|nr:phosphatase PAP2 family protein [Zhihengliuella halotolerans]
MNHVSQVRDDARIARPLGWLVALVFAGAAFAAVYAFFILSPVGQQIDENALLGAHRYLEQQDIAREPAMVFLGKLPQISALLGSVALLVSAVVHRSVAAPLITLAGMGGAVLCTQILKHVILDRPDMGISAATINSFPSGHTTLATASMVAIFCMVTPRWRPLIACLGGVYAALAGAATLVLGWHRPADIVGAFLIVLWFSLVTGWILTLAVPRWNRWRTLRFWGAARGWRAAMHVPGLLALAASIVLFAVLPPVETGENYRLLLGFLGGGVLMIGGAALTLFGLMNEIFMYQSRERGRK